MQVLHPHAVLEQVVRQVLCHALGQRRDQDPLLPLGPLLDLAHQVVDLPLRGLDDDLGIDESGRSDDLLDDVALHLGQLVGAGRGREVHGLPDALDELVPSQRPVVHRARQPEAVLHQRALAAHVALVHRRRSAAP